MKRRYIYIIYNNLITENIIIIIYQFYIALFHLSMLKDAFHILILIWHCYVQTYICKTTFHTWIAAIDDQGCPQENQSGGRLGMANRAMRHQRVTGRVWKGIAPFCWGVRRPPQENFYFLQGLGVCITKKIRKKIFWKKKNLKIVLNNFFWGGGEYWVNTSSGGRGAPTTAHRGDIPGW